MKLLTVHSDFLEFEPISKAIKSAEEVEKAKTRVEECLVAFIAVEKDDEDVLGTAKAGVDEIKKVAEQVKSKSVVLYPWVHLTQNPCGLDMALNTMKEMEKILKEDGSLEISRAPFGWYKAFDLKCKGHPLSELSRSINTKEGISGSARYSGTGKAYELSGTDKIKLQENVSASLKAEDKLSKHYYILDLDGKLNEVSNFNFAKYPNLKKFTDYEISKVRAYDKEPPHIRIMHEHNIADNEPGSDSGNLRWYPNGRLIKKVLEKAISEYCIDYGAMEVETPIMYDFEHPSLKKYLNRFPARQYTVESDDKKYFLRFAACFGQFLIAHDTVISYKNLPLKIFELTRYSFRREQSGEVTGLKRLRAFTMPDMHTLCAEMETAKSEFASQFSKSMDWNANLDLDVEVGFRVQEDFYNENKEWVTALARKFGKPFFVEMFKERYAYFITKFEFNFVDTANKASALSTVQIDVENADTYDIAYTDADGKKKKPLILHTSLSGSLERVVYALLEAEALKMQEGKKAMLPLWLAPTQVRIVPISDKHAEYAIKAARDMGTQNVRVDIDDRQETLGKKLREAQREWIPYIAVIGDKEMESGKMSVTVRKTDAKKDMGAKEIVDEVHSITKGMPFEKLSLNILISKRPIIYQMQ